MMVFSYNKSGANADGALVKPARAVPTEIFALAESDSAVLRINYTLFNASIYLIKSLL